MTLLSCDCSLPHALYLHHHFQAYSRLDWSQQSIAAFLFFLKKILFVFGAFPFSSPAPPAGEDGASDEGAAAGAAETRAAEG